MKKGTSQLGKQSENRTVAFYLLPNIHIGQFSRGRHISANGCPTVRISAFVDENTKEAVPKLKSYIKDTTYYIHKVENLDVPPNAILFTFDVVSLYKKHP